MYVVCVCLYVCVCMCVYMYVVCVCVCVYVCVCVLNVIYTPHIGTYGNTDILSLVEIQNLQHYSTMDHPARVNMVAMVVCSKPWLVVVISQLECNHG